MLLSGTKIDSDGRPRPRPTSARPGLQQSTATVWQYSINFSVLKRLFFFNVIIRIEFV